MRVTSAPVSASSLAASAASLALNEPLRVDPAKTRIFGTGMTRVTTSDRCGTDYTPSCPGHSRWKRRRVARLCAGHPNSLAWRWLRNRDGRDKPGHDEQNQLAR